MAGAGSGAVTLQSGECCHQAALAMSARKESKLDALLHRAAASGDLLGARAALGSGRVHPDSMSADLAGGTPLMAAAGAGHSPLVRLLLAEGAEPGLR